ncbi:MAG: AraC family transcriptional regulator [Bacteroidota bacterium]
MKIQFENLSDRTDRSFSTMFNPNLSDLFFWHFHPEYELVYIAGASGTRHVGDHISTYQDSDLVLIGSNIPHLNFDYGVQTEYQKVVVHLKRSFVDQHLHATPELAGIQHLFLQAQRGIAFSGAIKEKVGQQLFALEGMPPFQQYLHLMVLLQELAEAESVEWLHPTPYENQYSAREQARLRDIYAFVDQQYHRKIELQEVADLSHLTKEAFCRYFKRITRQTFVQFLNRYRISQAKRMLMAGKRVSDACYSTGFESLSYFNRIFKQITGENPRAFRAKFRG